MNADEKMKMFPELQAQFPANGLVAKIDRVLGFQTGATVKLQCLDRGYRTILNVEIESPNIVAHCGPFARAMKKVIVTNFGGEVMKSGDGDIVAWIPVHLMYEVYGGGSNGVAVFDAWFNFTTREWTFRQAAEKGM